MIRDDSDVSGTRPQRVVDLGPLFTGAEAPAATAAPAEPAPTPRAREETQAFEAPGVLTEREKRERTERIKRECRPRLLELARLRRDSTELPGVTAKDVRAIADAKGLSALLGEQQRAWSWVAGWFGELCAEGMLTKWLFHGVVMRRPGTNGNDHVIYLDPYDSRATSGGAAA